MSAPVVKNAPAKVVTLAALRDGFKKRGASLRTSANGGFLVCQWGLVRHCADFAALLAFARQMGVSQ